VLVVQVAGGVVLVVLVLAFLFRGRFTRGGATSRDVRPTLPPSPYQPSRGFRILDGSEPESPHEVQLPRLDPNKEFVFNDPTTSLHEVSTPHLRHDEQWALDRSMRRAPHPRVRRRRRLAWFILVVVIVAGIVAAALAAAHPGDHGHHVGLAVAYGVAFAPPIS
jgi:hypothetical protein